MRSTSAIARFTVLLLGTAVFLVAYLGGVFRQEATWLLAAFGVYMAFLAMFIGYVILFPPTKQDSFWDRRAQQNEELRRNRLAAAQRLRDRIEPAADQPTN